eukprot:gene2855-283_t
MDIDNVDLAGISCHAAILLTDAIREKLHGSTDSAKDLLKTAKDSLGISQFESLSEHAQGLWSFLDVLFLLPSDQVFILNLCMDMSWNQIVRVACGENENPGKDALFCLKVFVSVALTKRKSSLIRNAEMECSAILEKLLRDQSVEDILMQRSLEPIANMALLLYTKTRSESLDTCAEFASFAQWASYGAECASYAPLQRCCSMPTLQAKNCITQDERQIFSIPKSFASLLGNRQDRRDIGGMHSDSRRTASDSIVCIADCTDGRRLCSSLQAYMLAIGSTQSSVIGLTWQGLKSFSQGQIETSTAFFHRALEIGKKSSVSKKEIEFGNLDHIVPADVVMQHCCVSIVGLAVYMQQQSTSSQAKALLQMATDLLAPSPNKPESHMIWDAVFTGRIPSELFWALVPYRPISSADIARIRWRCDGTDSKDERDPSDPSLLIEHALRLLRAGEVKEANDALRTVRQRGAVPPDLHSLHFEAEFRSGCLRHDAGAAWNLLQTVVKSVVADTHRNRDVVQALLWPRCTHDHQILAISALLTSPPKVELALQYAAGLGHASMQ